MKFSSLSFKVPAMIAGMCLATALVTAAVGYISARQSLLTQFEERLSLIAQTRTREIATWFEGIRSDLDVQRNSTDLREAINGFSFAMSQMGDNPGKLLASAADAIRTGQAFSGDDPVVRYMPVFRKFAPYFEAYAKANNYEDVFLIDTSGNVVYSRDVNKEFGANLTQGQFGASSLGKAFKDALATKKTVLEDFRPYAPDNGVPNAFMATPILNSSGRVIGVLALQLSNTLVDAVANAKIGLGRTGQVLLVGADRTLRNDARIEGGPKAGDKLPGSTQLAAALKSQEGVIPSALDSTGQPAMVAYGPLDLLGQHWAVLVEMSNAEILAPLKSLGQFLAIITAVTLVLALGLSIWAARGMTTPLERLRGAMRRLQDHDFKSEIPETKRGDELGEMGRTLEELRDKLAQASELDAEQRRRQEEQRAVVGALTEALGRLSDGDLGASLSQAFPADYEQLRTDFNAAVARLRDAMHAVSTTVAGIFDASNEIAHGAEDLSRRTENQAATLEETAAAMDELTVSVNSAAEGTARADQVVGEARQGAEASGQIVLQAVGAMKEIEESSKQISQIIGVIDDIAFQTNLLALNAGVEAARAGEAGRGFAVVASEVRALAQRSSEAAREIKDLISTSSRHVQSGVTLVGNTGEALKQLVEDVTNISGLVSNIATSSREQSIGLGEITGAVTQLDQVTQQNAAMVEEATAASQAMKRDATKLSDLVARFRLGDAMPPPAPAKPAAAPAAARIPAQVERVPLATQGNAALAAEPVDDDWQEF